MPPQCGAFSRDLQDKSQSPRYSPGVGGLWLQMTSALVLWVFLLASPVGCEPAPEEVFASQKPNALPTELSGCREIGNQTIFT